MQVISPFRCIISWLIRYVDMIIDNDPPIERHISVPKDFSQLSCSSFTAGIVEAVLDGLCFVSCIISIAIICKAELFLACKSVLA
jgi:hypothetical protein